MLRIDLLRASGEGIQARGIDHQRLLDLIDDVANERVTLFIIAQARTDDLVLIAGKGHEDYQIIGREVFHFDDKEVAREALNECTANS